MKKHDKYFNILYKLANAVDPVGNQKLSACLVYKNDIISFGINKRKSHPLQKKYGKNEFAIYQHAEMNSIINALREYEVDFLKKCTLYVLRVKSDIINHKKMIIGMSKPCRGCQHAIKSFQLKNCYYTTDEGSYEVLI